MRALPIVLFGRDYWNKVVNFAALAEEGMIAEADLKLFEIVDTPEEGWASLIRRGLSPEAAPPLKLSLPPVAGRKRPAKRKPRRGG
jgi:predicted Rossmann-fold nucleotide-binding protein